MPVYSLYFPRKVTNKSIYSQNDIHFPIILSIFTLFSPQKIINKFNYSHHNFHFLITLSHSAFFPQKIINKSIYSHQNLNFPIVLSTFTLFSPGNFQINPFIPRKTPTFPLFYPPFHFIFPGKFHLGNKIRWGWGQIILKGIFPPLISLESSLPSIPIF